MAGLHSINLSLMFLNNKLHSVANLKEIDPDKVTFILDLLK